MGGTPPSPHRPALQVVGGRVMVAMSVTMMTDQMSVLAIRFSSDISDFCSRSDDPIE